jgi:hypothetical protein
MKLHKVEVEWIDSHSFSRWVDRETRIAHATETTLKPMKACGYLLSRKNGVLLITSCYDPDYGDVLDTMAIPTGCVKSMRRIE